MKCPDVPLKWRFRIMYLLLPALAVIFLDGMWHVGKALQPQAPDKVFSNQFYQHYQPGFARTGASIGKVTCRASTNGDHYCQVAVVRLQCNYVRVNKDLVVTNATQIPCDSKTRMQVAPLPRQ